MSQNVHLIKLAPGAKTIDTVRTWTERQIARAKSLGLSHQAAITTRNSPKRVEELVNGGSLYWVTGGQISGRQAIKAIETAVDGDGKKYCIISLEPEIVEVRLTPKRAFQGWRYLNPEDAPADLDLNEKDQTQDMPDDMKAHLQAIGIL